MAASEFLSAWMDRKAAEDVHRGESQTSEDAYNRIQGLQERVEEKAIDFENLWDNYQKIEHTNSSGDDIYDNHCAINVSEALLASGVSLNGFSGATCNSNCSSKRKHALRAQDLATYLKNKYQKLDLGKPLELTGANWEKSVKGKKGIIFFKDYWHRNGEKGDVRTGDHIDLWNKNELHSSGYFGTLGRTIFPWISEHWFNSIQAQDCYANEKLSGAGMRRGFVFGFQCRPCYYCQNTLAASKKPYFNSPFLFKEVCINSYKQNSMSTRYKFVDNKAVYFTTATVVGWSDIFTRDMYKTILLDSTRQAQVC